VLSNGAATAGRDRQGPGVHGQLDVHRRRRHGPDRPHRQHVRRRADRVDDRQGRYVGSKRYIRVITTAGTAALFSAVVVRGTCATPAARPSNPPTCAGPPARRGPRPLAPDPRKPPCRSRCSRPRPAARTASRSNTYDAGETYDVPRPRRRVRRAGSPNASTRREARGQAEGQGAKTKNAGAAPENKSVDRCPPTDLVALEDVRAHLQLQTPRPSRTTVIEGLIARYSVAIARYCGREFAPAARHRDPPASGASRPAPRRPLRRRPRPV
jgi:hypothetical protein